MRWANTWHVLLVLGAYGCGDSDSKPSSSQGELGRGDFTYGCYNSTDSFCTGNRHDFPEAIALDGWFELDFVDMSGRAGRIVSGSAAIEEADLGLHAVRPGLAAMLALSGDSEVVDLLHVRVLAVDDLQLVLSGGALDRRAASYDTLELSTGESLLARPGPLDKRGEAMAGVLEYDWSSSDPSILMVTARRDGAEATLTPLQVGQATLVVTTGELEVSFDVVVDDRREPSVGDAGADDDAGAVSDGGVPPSGLNGGTDAGAPMAEGGASASDGGSPGSDAGVADASTSEGGAQ